MVKFFKHLFLLLLLIVLNIQFIDAQISAKDKKGFITTYNIKKKVKEDSIYIYLNALPQTFYAKSPWKDSAQYTWIKLDTATLLFKDTIRKSVRLLDTVNLFPNGCYKLNLKNTVSGKDTFFRVWLMNVVTDSIVIELDKDGSDFVPYFKNTCEYIDFDLTKNTYPTNFLYYNPDTIKKKLYLENKFSGKIVSSYAEKGKADEFIKKSKIPIMRDVSPLPPENCKYTLTVVDMLGIERTDEVNYKSIVPQAMFTLKVASSTIVEGKNSAPCIVLFSNKSIGNNIFKYKYSWGDGDTLAPYRRWIEGLGKYEDSCHIYQFSGDTVKGYRITLTVESESGCIDSTTESEDFGGDDALAKYIIVAPPKIDEPKFPNVFTPDATSNAIFKLTKNYSIGHFSITILSRWGNVVYKETGDVLLDWKGWDGNVRGTGAKAADGLYYYVLEVFPQEIPSKVGKWTSQYKGFFYLFRAH